MANFNPDTCVCGKLTEDLTETDTSIPGLSLDLDVDEFTYLTLDNGIKCEHVKVSQTANGLTIERGEGSTSPCAWPKGACYQFKWSAVAFKAMVDCILNNDDIPDDTPKIEGFTPTIVDGVLCYMQDDTDTENDYTTVTIQDWECIYTFSAKNVKKNPIPNSQRLMPGVYENATVTVGDNGCITNVKAGCKTTIQGCTKCNTCDDEET